MMAKEKIVIFHHDERGAVRTWSEIGELVRCRDCKWCVEDYGTDGNVPYWVCKNWDGGTDADGYCYVGERRE